MKRKKRPTARRIALTFRDRVKGLAWLPITRVVAAEKNFRTHDDHQRGVLRGLLKEIGVAGAVLVWIPSERARDALRAVPTGDRAAFDAWLASYDGPVHLIDGHMRAEEIRTQSLPVLVTDLDEAEAAKALATFDAVSDLASEDKALLASLLEDIGAPVEDGTADLLEELAKLAGKEEDDADDTGAPDQSGDAQTDFAVVVECADEAAQLSVIELCQEKGWQCRALI